MINFIERSGQLGVLMFIVVQRNNVCVHWPIHFALLGISKHAETIKIDDRNAADFVDKIQFC